MGTAIVAAVIALPVMLAGLVIERLEAREAAPARRSRR